MADIWSAIYWGDYGRKTAHLSLMEHGAYLLLMKHYYSTGKPIDANASVLHRVCTCTDDAERDACDRVIGQFFYRDGDVYRHKRIDEELTKSRHKSEIRKKSADIRWQKPDAIADANAMQMHMQTDTQPQPQPQPYLQPPFLSSQAPKAKKGSRLPESFRVSDEHREWALRNALPSPDDHIEAFQDYWKSQPGQRGVKLDWDATFRNWLRKTGERKNGNGKGKPNVFEIARQAISELES